MMRDVENYYWHNQIYIKDEGKIQQQIIPILVPLAQIKYIHNCLFESLNVRVQDASIVENILKNAQKSDDEHRPKYKLLILLDGYDELRKPINIYKLNQFG